MFSPGAATAAAAAAAAAAQPGGAGAGAATAAAAAVAVHAAGALKKLRPRTGTLKTEYGVVRTPDAIMTTRRGSVPFLTPDMCCASSEQSHHDDDDEHEHDKTQRRRKQKEEEEDGGGGGGEQETSSCSSPTLRGFGVHVSIPELCESAAHVRSRKKHMRGDQKHIDAKINVEPDAIFQKAFAGARTSFGHRTTPAIVASARAAAPVYLENHHNSGGEKRRSDATRLSVDAPAGSCFLSPETYVDAVERLGADVYVALADEAPTSKRAKAEAVTLSLGWLEAIAREHNARKWADTRLLMAMVVGGKGDADRQRCVRGVLDAGDAVAGVVVGGIHAAENADERSAIIASSIQDLSPRLLRAVWDVDEPKDILDAVHLGIDIFSGDYPLRATERGHALTLPRWMSNENSATETATASSSSSMYIDLSDKCHERDARPFVEGCSCYACTNHSRAYVHHLLNCNEMLHQTLLMIHNVHAFQLFFEDIRRAINEDKFEDFRSSFCTACK